MPPKATGNRHLSATSQNAKKILELLLPGCRAAGSTPQAARKTLFTWGFISFCEAGILAPAVCRAG